VSGGLVPPESNVLFYTSPQGKVRVEVIFQQESFWLTLNRIAELFGTSKQLVSYHLRNIFESKELDRSRTVKEHLTVQREGDREVSRRLDYYSLDAVIAVGYRVNSYEATQFRIWATDTLKEFVVKGFVLDDERLKQGEQFGADYFEELLQRIREIRASERRFYLKITDIYEQCSADYDPNASITKTFFQTVQNKLHWAITGQTAAEIVVRRADASKPNMGLTTWKAAPTGRIAKSDVSIAKNYLAEKEIRELEQIVSMYLDFAELQASRRNAMRMKDWVEKLDGFLQFNEYEILTNPGSVSHEVAQGLAEGEYEKFRAIRDHEILSDFEREVKRLGSGKRPGKRRRKRETD